MQAFVSFLCLLLLLQASSCQLTQQYGDAQNTLLTIPAGLPSPSQFYGMPTQLGPYQQYLGFSTDFVMDNENNVYTSFPDKYFTVSVRMALAKFSCTNQTLWSVEIPAHQTWFNFKLAIHEHILVAIYNTHSYAVDTETGQILWSSKMMCDVNRVAVAQDHDQQYYIYALCTTKLWKLSLVDGSKMWSEPIPHITAFAISPGIVFGANGNSLTAYSTKNGTSLWSQRNYQNPCSNFDEHCLMLNLKSQLLYTFHNQTLYAFMFNGSLAFSTDVNAEIISFGLAPPEHDLIYIAACANHLRLFALGASNGSSIPQKFIKFCNTSQLCDGIDQFYVSQDNNIYLKYDHLYFIDGESFQISAQLDLSNLVYGIPFAFSTQGQILVGNSYIYAYSPSECPNGCSNNGVCQSYGKCSCNQGYEGPYCDKCVPNYYGNNCSRYCEKNETCNGNGLCNNQGQCVCNHHFTGDNCNKCATHWYGLPCDTYCSAAFSCNDNGKCGSHGECICNNYFSNQTDCYSCMPNYYGDECNTYCDVNITCHNRGSCTQAGLCLCEPNYYGEGCATFCIANTTCQGRGTCNSDGTCINCSGNYTGPTCSDCTANHYGTNCSLFCDASTTCSGHGQCSHEGKCLCSPHFASNNCSTCASDYYGAQCSTFCNANTKCYGNGGCDLQGQCQCFANFTANTNCSGCIEDHYGPQCSTVCNKATCKNGSCEADTGACTCLPGYTGSDCSEHEEKMAMSAGKIAGIVVGSVAALVLVVLVFWFVTKKTKAGYTSLH